MKLEYIPINLKLPKIIPIYKFGDETDPNNYRPISLLYSFDKIFEKIMYKRLHNYLTMKEFFCGAQYGFRKQHSTQHAILDIINKIQDNMDKKMYSCGIFIDLKKAFDTADHDILLGKLYHYGVRGVTTDYLRILSVAHKLLQVNTVHLRKKLLYVEYPKDQSLDLYFFIYINDICESSKVLKFFLLADDTNLLYADKDLKLLETVVNTY